MTVNEHTRWVDSAGAYVLGAMPADERERFEAHLETCPECREEVDELRPAAEALPMASPPVVPPRALKDRVMAEVEREAALLAQAGPDADRPRPAREKRRRGGWAWLSGWRLAPVAVALVLAGVLAGSLLGGGTKTYQFQGASAELEVTDDGATLVADNLAAPPEGKVYEVWLKPKGSDTPEPTDVLFTPRSDGAATAAIPGDVSDVEQVLVTAEPMGGSATPTSDPVMTATLS
jgi:anti-sigma-K factor RskA